jgi:shikimate kinase
LTAPALRRVLLVGFMGAGKTSVGEAVAARLGWRFVDFDRTIEETVGLTVHEIFATFGERVFREHEQRVADVLLREDGVVLGTGGGWAAAGGRLAKLPPGTETFWLLVSPVEALRRVSGEPGRRPLLDVEEPLREATELLQRRAAGYALARWTVDTDGSTVEDVTARILAILAAEYPEQTLNE